MSAEDRDHVREDEFDDEAMASDIAIVGMAARLPDARTVDEYWSNLTRGVESVRQFSEEELLEAGEAPARLRRSNYVRSGVVMPDIDLFDADFFGLSPKEAGIMDPQHRQFLECSWEALEDSGHVPDSFAGSIGVFAGCGMGSYFAFNILRNPDLLDSVGLFLLRHTGNDKDFLSTRVSYCFNLKGPSVNVQTACSTSLVATHMACQSLLSGECDLALAGGVTIEVPHKRGYLFQEGEILSPTGHCHPFDHRAQGTLFGSGVGVVTLRRLEDALEDGDPIHAVIKGSAINNDGAGKVGYLAPSVDGQAACVAEALEVSGVDARSVGYVECHGTGTYMGDPIEVSALTQAFRRTTDETGFCRLGSVKSNIGHLDTAAGVASLIKAGLAVKHGTIPASLNFELPNPNLGLEESPFEICSQAQEWVNADGAPRRAGVNSLGVGGTNAHLIVEEPPQARPGTPSTRKHHLLPLFAQSRGALDDGCARLAHYLRENPEADLADVSWTLITGRQRFPRGRILACRDRDEAIEWLESRDPKRIHDHVRADSASLVFMFPGGGAHYPNMARGLYETEPVFRDVIDRGVRILADRIGVDFFEFFLAEEKEEEQVAAKFLRMSHQLPAIFLVEYGLAELWLSRGVKPSALIGHSVGKNAAACVAGVLSFEDALSLVLLRGQLFEKVSGGGMLAVGLPPEEIEGRLPPELELAAVNAPELSVVSGPDDAISTLEKRLEAEELFPQRLAIPVAAHSRMLEPILDEFRGFLEGISLSAPQIPLVSNLTGTWMTPEQAMSPGYWSDHLRGRVRFSEGMSTLLEQEGRVFLEVGPGRALSSFARQQPSVGPDTNIMPSLRHAEEDVDDAQFWVGVEGRLAAAGIEIDLKGAFEGETRRRLRLPAYAFQHESYWIEAAESGVEPKDLGIERTEDMKDWGYRAEWVEAPLTPPAEVEAESLTWLIFMDSSGVGHRIRSDLDARGHKTIGVVQGDGYHSESPTDFVLSPEHGQDGYEALMADLEASGQTPDRVLHLWLLTVDEQARPGSSFFHRNLENGFYSLFFLARAMSGSLASSMEIHVVANGLFEVATEGLAYPEKATVLGPVGVIPREFDGVRCRAIDVVMPEVPSGLGVLRAGRYNRELDAVAEQAAQEITHDSENDQIAYRSGQRWQKTFVPTPLEEKPDADLPIREGGVYVITGGLGGVGLVVARSIARTPGVSLVLVSRSGLPQSDVFRRSGSAGAREAAIQELRDLGARVQVAAADVTDLEAMRGVLAEARQSFGEISGVVHAAGVVDDDLIQVKTELSIDLVFSAKVHGTQVLDALLRDEPLDFFVLFSSTSTAITPLGQVDYVAANAFLNAFARKDRQRGLHATQAVNWGLWKDVGMAADNLSGATASSEEAIPPSPSPYPLFAERVVRPSGEMILSGTISPDRDWILDEHRTKDGHALIPGTGYIELARAANAEAKNEGAFEIRDLFFFRPLAVADGEERAIRIEVSSQGEERNFRVRSQAILPDGRRGWEDHAEARLRPLGGPRPAVLDLDAVAARCGEPERAAAGETLRTGQDQFLAFGPRFRVLKRVAYGEGEALAELELDAKWRDDLAHYALHPALLDLATGFAMQLIDGYGTGDHLWVPVSYSSVQVYRSLPEKVFSWVQRRSEDEMATGMATFDVCLTDPLGECVMEVEGFSIRRLEAQGFALPSAPSAGEVELEETGVSESQMSPSELALIDNLSQGICASEGSSLFRRVLGVSAPELYATSLPLFELIAQADSLAASVTSSATDGARFARPQLDSDFVEPRDALETKLVEFWEELLGVEGVGVQDSFFDLGGHSLLAVRLFAMIKKEWDLEYPISVLFDAPSIEACAELIRPSIEGGDEAGGRAGAVHKPKYTHLVPMHSGSVSERTPFFLVAGMFGNVLNLRHLAHLVGADRPFYGLQARGLYGDHRPHETFEEMARDYLEEVRMIQPHGPYLLGGFSGGGIAAFEMARQLLEVGEEIRTVILLDTPLPVRELPSRSDRLKIHSQRLKRKGPSYLTDFVRDRIAWELDKVRSRRSPQETEVLSPAEFRSDEIRAAFEAALPRYEMTSLPVQVQLFRPRQNVAYDLGEGRILNEALEFLIPDNGWTDWVEELQVSEVPGNHDSMVLEPNVRVLASRIQASLDEADAKADDQPIAGPRRSG